jgi:hypothetical protein
MIERNFKIDPKDEEIKKVVGSKLDRMLKSERNRLAYEEAKKDVVRLVKPAVGWNTFKIKAFEDDQVVLENGIKIGGGPVTKIVKGAEELLVALITIGQDLECQVKKYMTNDKMFQGILLDGFASWAVDNVRNQFLEKIKKDLHANHGLRTSIIVSPGEIDWLIQDQKVIFTLLKEESIQMGVQLRDSMLMLPLKSLTFIMGIGSKPLGKEAGKNCDICSMREKCRFKETRMD